METFQQVSNHCVASVGCIGHREQTLYLAGREKCTAVETFVSKIERYSVIYYTSSSSLDGG